MQYAIWFNHKIYIMNTILYVSSIMQLLLLLPAKLFIIESSLIRWSDAFEWMEQHLIKIFTDDGYGDCRMKALRNLNNIYIF